MRDFRLVWASSAISGIGSWLLIVAIPVHVFQVTGSVAATGLALALESLPALAIGPWAGVLLDRWHLARAMWLADLVSAAAVALILFADSPSRIWLVYVAILVESVATTVFRPAARALVPAVVGTGPELARANALTAFSGSVIRLAAPPLGALLLAGPGITFVLYTDIASYLLSAAIIGAIRTQPPRSQGEAARPLEGFRYAGRHQALRGLLLGNGIFFTANAGLTALLVPLTVDRLHAPGSMVGYLISGLGAGYLVGAALATKAQSWLGIRDLLATTQAVAAVAFFGLVNAPSVPWAIAATFLLGIPGSILLITTQTTLQRATPSDLLGRVGALFFAMDALTVIVGALLAPALTHLAGLPVTLNLLAAMAVLAAPVTLAAVPRHPADISLPRTTPSPKP
ncbi:putative MFS family arabinose efflux permease [Kribbella amoyensis]|uniref:Putative MFS family arabinose efflux permease n=1 Tax=Kribbella amoyensis TaxID=996641 RepID=A0A561BQ58_9ACTN|nr:MFS transporter [Kribbella amoyensis]TWD80953.1 putative MFS family arabinose efflux permease [Kribbella amoyensis]